MKISRLIVKLLDWATSHKIPEREHQSEERRRFDRHLKDIELGRAEVDQLIEEPHIMD